MAVEDIERLARKFQTDHPELASLIRATIPVARKLEVPEQLEQTFTAPEIKSNQTAVPVLDLGKEWMRQTEMLADRFAQPLKVSRNQYIDGLPQFPPKPDSYNGKLDIPALVQTPNKEAGLTLSRMLEILGIKAWYKVDQTKDWEDDPKKFETKLPYSSWLDDGSFSLRQKVADVRRRLATDQRGGTVYDTLALYIIDPDILKKRYLDCPGSQFGRGSAPYLGLWDDEPGLDYDLVGGAYPLFGSLLAGREIVTGKLAS